MIPDSTKRDPRPEYIRALIAKAGLTQRAAAKRIGISDRLIRYYTAGPEADGRPAPYCVQYALEALARDLE